ncbi:MAG: aldehyde dehydrogenase (NADP(+)) [Nitriliruptorales bacterium]|nr:aldehyde dehydrogenase (NADP(+)) [Nitriliruptorales bacterium]
MTTLTGANLVAGEERTTGPPTIESIDPRSQEVREVRAHEATSAEVAAACERAAEAAEEVARWTPGERAGLLRRIADDLDAEGGRIVALADSETGLGAHPRLEGELERTTGQLRFLAEVVEDGAWLEVMIDRQDDGPTIRRMLRPLGPVSVFGASNFPLAFSVAGGDTAAALGVGCPVVVKAHPSHPLTSELVGRLVSRSIEEADAPPGAFSLVHGFRAGEQVVDDPRIRAVAFTGSFAGGTAIADRAARRDRPISVYAEMGSLNPIVITPETARTRPADTAEGFVGSMTLGTGQFCTKPGLLFIPSGAAELETAIVERLRAQDPAPMLNAGLLGAWEDGVRRWASLDELEVLIPLEPVEEGGTWVRPALVAATAERFILSDVLHDECFGPVAIIVRYDDRADLVAALRSVPGTLAAGVHGSPDDELAVELVGVLSENAGRVVWNGWPTGVAVVWSMHHGGPYPATTAPLHTSVGAAALRRFLRPVAYQGVPEELLPPPVRDDNPWRLPRRVDGELLLP